MSENLIPYTAAQVLAQCLDLATPGAPALRISGGSGGGGGGNVEGVIVADAPVSTTKPILLGGYGSTATPGATSADGDLTSIWVDRNGRVQVSLASAIPAGSAVIGHVIVDSGTVTLAAGTAVIGHVILDASSAVIGHIIVDSGSIALSAAIPAGANVIGHVIVDSGAVSLSAALPAGTNYIGCVTSPTIAGGGAQTTVSITTSSTAIATADSTRVELILRNHGSVDAYLNHGAAATVADGMPFPAGSVFTFTGGMAKLAWNGIVASSTTSCKVMTGTV